MSKSIITKMYELGMLRQPKRQGCLAEARVAIIEGRVKLNGVTVHPIRQIQSDGSYKYYDPMIPSRKDTYTIILHSFNSGQDIIGTFTI